MTLTIPSDLSFLSLARAFADAACRRRGLDESSTAAVVLAVNEALSNIIRHAHRDRPETLVHLECLFRPDGIEVRLTDEGDPFDPAGVAVPDPSELRIGGRGIFLMRTLMDELICEQRGPRGNVLRMIKRIRVPPSAKG